MLPQHVADAINILRHEKIGRWCSRDWWWVDDPEYDPEAKKIGHGYLERRKQEAVYCTVTADGTFRSPSITEKEAEEAVARTYQMLDVARGLTLGTLTKEYDAVTNVLRELFNGLRDGDGRAGGCLLAVGDEDVKKEVERRSQGQRGLLTEIS